MSRKVRQDSISRRDVNITERQSIIKLELTISLVRWKLLLTLVKEASGMMGANPTGMSYKKNGRRGNRTSRIDKYFACGSPVFPIPFIEETILFPLYNLGCFIIN